MDSTPLLTLYLEKEPSRLAQTIQMQMMSILFHKVLRNSGPMEPLLTGIQEMLLLTNHSDKQILLRFKKSHLSNFQSRWTNTPSVIGGDS